MIPLDARLQEVGKIKIGMKGERKEKSGGGGTFAMPKKLDHFIVTMNVRDRESDNFYIDQPVHDKMMLQNDWTRIPIRFLFPTIEGNWESTLSHYVGTKPWCVSKDAKIATRANTDGNLPGAKWTGGTHNEPCLFKSCPYFGKDDKGRVLGCKPFATLSVVLPWSQQLGGVYKFRTTSWASIQNIQSQLQYFDIMTRGNLNTVDFELRISPKSTSFNSPDGPKGTTIFEVGVFYPGDAQKLLQDARRLAESLAKDEKAYVAMLRERDRYLALSAPEVVGEVDDEVAEEFFPEQVIREMEVAGPVEVVQQAAPAGPVKAAAQAVKAAKAAAKVQAPATGQKPTTGILAGMEGL